MVYVLLLCLGSLIFFDVCEHVLDVGEDNADIFMFFILYVVIKVFMCPFFDQMIDEDFEIVIISVCFNLVNIFCSKWEGGSYISLLANPIIVLSL